MPHGPAAVSRESVTIEIDDVDVDRPQRVSFFKNPGASVDQRVNTAIDNLFGGNLPRRNSALGAPLLHQRSHFGIGTRAPVLVVAVPPLRRFLSVAPHFTKTVLSERLADSRFFQMTTFLANAPAHVE